LAQHQSDDDGASLWKNTSFRRRVREIEIASMALHWTEQRLVYSLPVGQNIGDATASLMKLAWSETSQKVTELALDAIGPYGAVQQNDESPVGGEAAATPLARYLTERVNTIAGGSSEIQRNIIARFLGV
jgi:alkylation response protein AidB-like acyl-CoA dehydrogenase